MTSKGRILVVEDDPSILQVTKFRLQHEGYDVLTAVDGEQALDTAASHLPIHVILLDIKLPKLDGYVVCQRLKRRKDTAGIPVIIFTASESQMQQLADRCLDVGASDWIRKPFRTAELLSKIRRVMNPEGESRDG